jgi:hypothetical protein
MSESGCTIFTTSADPRPLVYAAARAAGATIDGDERSWKEIELKVKLGFFRTATMRLSAMTRDADRTGFNRNLSGMQGYYRQLPAADEARRQQLLALIPWFSAMIGIHCDREFAPEHLELIFDIARRLDGLVLFPERLLDAAARVVMGIDGSRDPAATLPPIPEQTEEPMAFDDEEDDVDVEPPAPEAVLRRAQILVALAARGFGQTPFRRGPADEIRTWFDARGLRAFAEPEEIALIEATKLNDREVVGATWGIEGAGVLAWSLGLMELPPHDVSVDLKVVGDACGFRSNDDPPLRPIAHAELEAKAAQLLTIHWRLREFIFVNRTPIDFAEVASREYLPLKIDGIRLVDGDLAVVRWPIASAPPDEVQRCMSIAYERHRAINWLLGSAEPYSEVDTAT